MTVTGAAALLSVDSVDGARQAGQLAGSLLPVHGALAGGLGQHGSGNSQSAAGLFLVVAGDGGAHSLDGVLHAGTGSAVAGCRQYHLTCWKRQRWMEPTADSGFSR